MTERTIVITGGTGGIGLESAIGIAKKAVEDGISLHLLLTGRNDERGASAVQRVKDESKAVDMDIRFVKGDVSTNASVDALAAALMKESSKKIDVLINNAGFLGDSYLKSDDEDQFEMHFAVNVRAPWRLTTALLPALVKGSRVVNVTGGDERPDPIDPDNLMAEKGFRGLMTYGHSKAIMEGMSMAMAPKWQAQGVYLNVVFPGRASTAMTQSLSMNSLPGPMKLFYPLFKLMFRDDGGKGAAKAAQSSIFAATSPELEGVFGKYYDTSCKERKLHATAYDSAIQEKIMGVLEGKATS